MVGESIFILSLWALNKVITLKKTSQNLLGIGVVGEPVKLLKRCDDNYPSATQNRILDLKIVLRLPSIILIIFLILYLKCRLYKSIYKNIKSLRLIF